MWDNIEGETVCSYSWIVDLIEQLRENSETIISRLQFGGESVDSDHKRVYVQGNDRHYLGRGSVSSNTLMV